MLTNIFNWTKNNKLATFIIFVLGLVVIFKGQYGYIPYMMGNRSLYQSDINTISGREVSTSPEKMIAGGAPRGMGGGGVNIPYAQATPTLNVTDRKVITEASLSLQVKSVEETVNNVTTKVNGLGGYVVNANISRPEFGESATLTVRVPSAAITEFLSFVKTNAVKVINENISGSDITDQYVDLDTRLAQLVAQKTKLEAILNSAVTVQDIMAVQPYITQIQNEIDSVKGQTNYIDGATKSSLISMYLSTDELSLPYAPEQSWRPQAILKNAIRSLILHVQTAGTALIWLGVYSLVIVPALSIVLIIYLLKKRKQR